MMLQSPSKQAPWDLTQFFQSPSAAPSYFSEFHRWSEVSSLSKVISVLRKARSHRAPNLGCRGLSHLGDLIFHQKTLHETWHMSRCVVVVKVPITSCPQLQPLSHPNSFCRGMFKLNAKFSADLLLYSLSHFECDGHTGHTLTQRPHWLVQWSHHCSHTCIPVHSPWLPGHVNVMQTVFIILTMAGLFPDRPCI